MQVAGGPQMMSKLRLPKTTNNYTNPMRIPSRLFPQILQSSHHESRHSTIGYGRVAQWQGV